MAETPAVETPPLPTTPPAPKPVVPSAPAAPALPTAPTAADAQAAASAALPDPQLPTKPVDQNPIAAPSPHVPLGALSASSTAPAPAPAVHESPSHAEAEHAGAAHAEAHAGHDHHKFDFAALNASHNSPYSAVEWIHGHPVLILNLAQYADTNYAALASKPNFHGISTSDNQPWAEQYVQKHYVAKGKAGPDATGLAKAMTIARQDSVLGAFPQALSFFNHQTFWSTIALLLAAALLLVFARRKPDQYKPAGRVQHMLEAMVLFVRDDIVRPNIHHGDKWVPFLASLFIALLACNLFGLIPLFGTATGQIAVTAAFAAVIGLLMLVMGIKENGPVLFWFRLIPVKFSWNPMDLFVYCLLAVLEWLSLVIRPAVLAIRLFANMLAGHTVLLVFLSLGFIIHASNGHIAMAGGLGVLGWLIAIPFYVLELLVALIQAYIFVLLSAIFIGQCAHPEH